MVLKQAASNYGDLAAATCAPEKDWPNVDTNLVVKSLFPIDSAGALNTTSPTKIVCKLMSVDDGWNDKIVIKHHIETEWRRALPYKCLDPCLYCKECDADCYICAYDNKYIEADSKNKGWYDT